MPRIVTAAVSNRLNPSIGRIRSLIRRWSCSTTLFKYLQDRIRTRRGNVPASFRFVTARCDAAYPSKVITLGAPMLLRRPGKEPLDGGHITPFAQEEIDGATLFVHGAVQVNPLAAHLEIRLIHSPRTAHRPRIMVPALLKVRHVALYPTQDGRVGQHDAAFRHHLDQVT